MAKMPTSGAASTADIQATFGTPTAGNTSQLYRGGSYVPDIPNNSSVPASGAADSADYYGATDYTSMSAPSLSSTSHTMKGASLSGSFTLWSPTITCPQPSGGIGPYSYAWEKVSGQTLGLTAASSASTQLALTTIGADLTGVYRCKVTDSQGRVVYSNSVSCRFIHYDVHEAYIQSASNSVASGSTGYAAVRLRRDGKAENREGAGYAVRGDWVYPNHATVGDDFEVYINNDDTGISGANSDVDSVSPGLNTWGTINTTRYAQELNSISGTTEKCGVRLRVRLRSGVGINMQTYPIDKIVGLTVSVTSGGMGAIGMIVSGTDIP